MKWTLRSVVWLLLVVLSSTSIVLALPFDGVLLEDFNGFPYLWRSSPTVTLTNLAIGQGDPLALPGQGPTEGLLSVTAPMRIVVQVNGTLCNSGNGVVTVVIPTTSSFDAATVDQRTVTFGRAHEAHVDRDGVARRHLEDADDDGDLDLVLHFRASDTGVPCGSSAITPRPTVSTRTSSGSSARAPAAICR